MNKLIILDLDDTIFETRTITKESIDPILMKFENIAIQKYGSAHTNQIISKLWEFPFDVVAQQYNLDECVKLELSKSISNLSFELNIEPYKDFEIFNSMSIEKILVTTGFERFQRAKIKSLRIDKMFSKIYIDDILDQNRIFKKGIFGKILKTKNVKQDQIYIIGDSPESELKAGYELGLQTIQISREEQSKSRYANYIVNDFNEIIDIIS